MTRHPSEGPDAFRTRACAARPELAQPIDSISELYIRLRYGEIGRTTAHAADLVQLQREVKSFRPESAGTIFGRAASQAGCSAAAA